MQTSEALFPQRMSPFARQEQYALTTFRLGQCAMEPWLLCAWYGEYVAACFTYAHANAVFACVPCGHNSYLPLALIRDFRDILGKGIHQPGNAAHTFPTLK